MYENLQTISFGLFLSGSFFFLFYGIGRNRDHFTFFAVIMHCNLLSFYTFRFVPTLLNLSLFQPEHGWIIKKLFWEAETTIELFNYDASGLNAIIGIETRFPGFDKAILYHVGVQSPKKRPPENVDENLGEI
jgi:hypothetical protein